MALAETAELAVKLSLDDAQFGKAINRIDRRLGAFSGAVNRNLGRAVDSAATFAVRGLVGAFKGGVESLRELDTVVTQTNAVIASTGHVAGVTADEVRRLAEKYEDLNAQIDDKKIQDAENRLLTFTKIGKDVFEPALATVLDFAQATGTDATAAAKLFGRALNDPVKGMTMLRRAGISLEPVTEKRIKQLVKEGKLTEAQNILIAEMTKRYGGSFAAAGDTAAGKQAKLADAIEDVQKALASKLLPVVTKVSERITKYLAKPETIAFFEKLGATIASLFTDENLDAAAGAIETAASAVGVAIKAFNSLPPEIKALAIGAFTLNKVTGGAVGGVAATFGKILGAGLSKIFAANVTVIGKNVTGGGGPNLLDPSDGKTPTSKVGKVLDVASKLLIVGIVAEIADAFKPVIVQTGIDLHNALQVPDFKLPIPDEWPWGPKNTPTLLPDLFGGNGLLGGQAADTAPHGALTGGAPGGHGGDIAAQLHLLRAQLAEAKKEHNSKLAARLTREINALKATAAAAKSKAATDAARQKAATDAVKAKQQQSLLAFRAGERASLTGNSLARTANARLGSIARKKTSFHIKQTFNAYTRVSVSEVQRQARYTSRVARSTALSAS